VLTALALAFLCGCASTRGALDSPNQRSPERLAEAHRLAYDAQEASARGKIDEAIALNRRAVAAWAELPAAWNNMGALLLGKENYLEAAEAFKIAANLSPGDPIPLENVALVYHRAGFDDDALDYYLQALERNPNHLAALRGAAMAAESTGRLNALTRLQIQRALMQEKATSPWRSLFERLRIRLDEYDRMRREP